MPQASAHQMSALEKGNAIRSTRAQIKRDLTSGAQMIDDLLVDLPPEVEGVPIGTVLSWCPGLHTRYGGTRLRKLMDGIISDPLMPTGDVLKSVRWVVGRRALRYQRTLVNK